MCRMTDILYHTTDGYNLFASLPLDLYPILEDLV